MDEEPNPIKDVLYEIIEELGEKRIQDNIVKGNSSHVINEIIVKAQTKIADIEEKQEIKISKFLTSLLHYILALTLVPSQRKITFNGTYIDIVIPDIRTLKTKPLESILICIPELHKTSINEQIDIMEKIQPKKENIWYITEERLDKKTYSIKNSTILKILDDIKEFLASKKTVQFTFFKA